MRTDVTYNEALSTICSGFAQLAVCVYRTIMANKALSLLIVSVLANCALVVALAQERAENDCISQHNMELEIENDSLGGTSTNISYRVQ